MAMPASDRIDSLRRDLERMRVQNDLEQLVYEKLRWIQLRSAIAATDADQLALQLIDDFVEEYEEDISDQKTKLSDEYGDSIEDINAVVERGHLKFPSWTVQHFSLLLGFLQQLMLSSFTPKTLKEASPESTTRPFTSFRMTIT